MRKFTPNTRTKGKFAYDTEVQRRDKGASERVSAV